MFISYKGTLYNLALMVQIVRNGRKVYLMQDDNNGDSIKCDSEEEAKRVMNNIEGITKCVFIDN